MKILLFTILLTGFFAKVYAQNPSHELKLIFYNTLLIRWAPNSMQTWKKAIDFGYILQKININVLAQGSKNWENLSNKAIQSMSLIQMKQRSVEENNVFIDKDYKINQIYFYKIKPVSKKGAAGKASEPVKIQIK